MFSEGSADPPGGDDVVDDLMDVGDVAGVLGGGAAARVFCSSGGRLALRLM
ncbi:hypothetical protein [Nocardia donostiensis]|uniref:hypothetical protein n=1 Tax=Nocardia donostiensis TaxID=1538463 RepID=UPI0020CA45DB|nr:hypothetical protein [Nocardia donostiensis]